MVPVDAVAEAKSERGQNEPDVKGVADADRCHARTVAPRPAIAPVDTPVCTRADGQPGTARVIHGRDGTDEVRA